LVRGRTFQEYTKKLLNYEIGSVTIKRGAPVRIALVYPNRYSVGMASLGFQTVYRLFNEHPEVRCERAFVLGAPFHREIRTLESGERLDTFDIVGFSLSFELDLLNVVRFLIQSRIPLFAKDRGEKDPLIVVGGVVASLNPSPLLPFVDGLLVGEGEGVLYRMADVLFRFRQGREYRQDRLQALSEIDGVFIPKLNTAVRRHFVPSLENYPVYTPIVTPLSHFEEMFVVEVVRGCTRGCFFCGAQKVYSPYRFRSGESIVETVARWNPGAKRVGLEGAGLSDYPDLEGLCGTLVDMGYEVSFSSIRADRVTPELVKMLERGGVRSFAIAPEAGTERLRQCIGKGIKDSILLDVVRLLGDSSVKVLKLYFLIGLPGETDEDVEAVVGLVRELAAIFTKRDKGKRIRLSVNGFIPKPFTEFQWAPMASEKELSRKRRMIRKGLKEERGISIVPKSSREEVLQGILSLGDEGVGYAMVDAIEKGVSWKKALKERDVDITKLLHQERHFESELPWDFVVSEISKEQLWERYRRHISEGSFL